MLKVGTAKRKKEACGAYQIPISDFIRSRSDHGNKRNLETICQRLGRTSSFAVPEGMRVQTNCPRLAIRLRNQAGCWGDGGSLELRRILERGASQ